MSDVAQSADRSIGTESREIKLTQGKVAIVDIEDFEELNKYNWVADKSRNTFYARKWGGVKMHRMILDAAKGEICDHINRNGLDNRRSNLRIVTHSENNYNCSLSKRSTTGHKGVYWYKKYKKWVAQAGGNGNRKTIGYYHDIQDAVTARKKYLDKKGIVA